MPCWLALSHWAAFCAINPCDLVSSNGAMNMMHRSDICPGMLFKTCEVRTVSYDNPPHTHTPPSLIHIQQLPSPPSTFLCITVTHTYSPQCLGKELHRLLSEMIMKTGQESPLPLSLSPIFSLALRLPHHPFSVNLSKHSSCNLLTLKNTDSICIHESLIVTKKSNHSAGC